MKLSGLAVAIAFMTRLPAPTIAGEAGRDLASAAPFLPVAGALVGACVAATLWATAGLGPQVSALIGLVVWVAVTGALHLDGLGDVADALGAAHGRPERFIEVARDPHVGGFGAVAMMLQLLAKLVVLTEVALSSPLLAVVLVPVWARWGTLVLAGAVPPLTHGMGERLAAGVTPAVVVVEGLALIAVSFIAAPVLMAGAVIPVLLAVYWRRRLGGITGDCHGASIEVTETLLLLLLVAMGP